MRTSSSVDGEYTVNLRYVFSVLKTIGQNSKSESLCPSHSLLACGAVNQNTRQLGDFADPPTVGFTFDIHREIAHEVNGTTAFVPEKETEKFILRADPSESRFLESAQALWE